MKIEFVCESACTSKDTCTMYMYLHGTCDTERETQNKYFTEIDQNG